MKSTENERLLLSTNFKAKFELAFFLAQENASSQRFYFKANKKTSDSTTKRYEAFLKSLHLKVY